jgi:hypothetical protein
MTRNRLYILVLALSFAGYGWLAWNLAVDGGGGARGNALPTPCLIRQATGVPCPSCGTTRAMEALAAGDVGRSASTNPFGLLLALALVAFPAWIVHDLARSRDGFHRFYLAVERTFRERRGVAFAGVAVVLANWGWNIVKGM